MSRNPTPTNKDEFPTVQSVGSFSDSDKAATPMNRELTRAPSPERTEEKPLKKILSKKEIKFAKVIEETSKKNEMAHAQSRFNVWQKNAAELKQARLTKEKEAADKAEAERLAKEAAQKEIPVHNRNRVTFAPAPQEKEEKTKCGCFFGK